VPESGGNGHVALLLSRRQPLGPSGWVSSCATLKLVVM
jgi:hypothetical protein